MAGKDERLADDQFVESVFSKPFKDNVSQIGTSVAEYIDNKVQPSFKNKEEKDIPRYMRGVKKIEVAIGNLIQQEFKNFCDDQLQGSMRQSNAGSRINKSGAFDAKTPKIEDFVATQISSNHPSNVSNYCSSKTYDGLTELHAI